MADSMAEALMAQVGEPMESEEVEPEGESMAFGTAAREVYDALKQEDFEGFKSALQAAININANEVV